MTSDISFKPRPQLNRRGAGLLALLYPLLLIGLASRVGFHGSSGVADLATAFLAAILFLVAAPTSWVFAIEFIEASRLTVLFLGAVTSLPLWYLLGAQLAARAENWLTWLKRYTVFCGLWTVVTFGLIVLLARIS